MQVTVTNGFLNRCSVCNKYIWPRQGEYLVQIDDFKPWHKKCYDEHYWRIFFERYEMGPVGKGTWIRKE